MPSFAAWRAAVFPLSTKPSRGRRISAPPPAPVGARVKTYLIVPISISDGPGYPKVSTEMFFLVFSRSKVKITTSVLEASEPS